MTGPRPRLVALGAVTVLLLTFAGVSPAAADPVPGAQTSGDSLFPHVGNGGYDVKHYDIDIDYDDVTGAIEATATIEATAADPLSSFSLDFEGLNIDSVEVDGAPAKHRRVDDAAAIKHKLIVRPATPVDGDFTTVVTYSGNPTTHVDPDGSSEGWVPTSDGVTVVNEPIGAMTYFPNNNTMKDKATFDFELTVPTEIDGDPAAAVSNGELVSKDVKGDRTTWSWKQSEQMATYLSVVSIGKFTMYQDDIHLEASNRTIKEYSFVDSDTKAADLADIEASRGKIEGILNYLEGKLGHYPGNSTGILVDNTDIGYALETQDRPFFEGSVDTSTLVHEMTHQWLGDAVSATDWSDLWLAEGPATFFEAQYAYDTDNTEPTPEAKFFKQWRHERTTSATWTTRMAGFDDPADLFGGQVYDRGAMSLEALRLTIGDDDFDALLVEWIDEHNGRTGSTADWIGLAEDISGTDLTAFYQDWAYDTDKPKWPGVLGSQTRHPTPRISGVAKVHRTLTARPGTWDPGTRLAFRWYVDGHRISAGQDGTLYVPGSAEGLRIQVRVTSAKIGYHHLSELSAKTARIG